MNNYRIIRRTAYFLSKSEKSRFRTPGGTLWFNTRNFPDDFIPTVQKRDPTYFQLTINREQFEHLKGLRPLSTLTFDLLYWIDDAFRSTNRESVSFYVEMHYFCVYWNWNYNMSDPFPRKYYADQLRELVDHLTTQIYLSETRDERD